MTGYVKIEKITGFGIVEFFHPSGNSLPGTILKDLAAAISSLSKDAEINILILKSAGEKVFCAGASFDELTSITTPEQGMEFFSGFAHVINAIRKSPKFVIGRIQGKAVGGGVGLAAACDYSLALNTAAVKLSELAVGIGPFVVGPAIERKIGLPGFSQLAIDATNWRSAEWAKNMGLYADVYDNIATLDAEIMKLANTLSGSNPDAMQEMKQIFWKGTEHWDALLPERAGISGRLVLSDFTRNALAAFKAKVKN